MRVVLLMLVLVSWIAAVVNSYDERAVEVNRIELRAPDSASEVSERKKRFKEGCSAAIESVPDLDAADVEEYAEYVEKFGKLDRYLNDGCEYERNYRAYEGNKRRIDELNANASPAEVVNGRVFTERYAVNEFTDCDDDCRKEYLKEMNQNQNRRRLRAGNRRESGGSESGAGSEWDLNSRCIELDQEYFADVNAAATVQDSMWSEECGAVKDQGVLSTCWAFSSTGQLQCNFNAAHQDTRVFSEKYGTDCSDEGSVTSGHSSENGYINEWYTDGGACSDYYKAYDQKDKTDVDGDCDCNAEKVYGQCYKFFPSADSAGKLAIANAAQLYALSFGAYLCSSFFDVAGDNAVWKGCAPGEASLGGHAMTIVGQSSGSYVLVRNSWGTKKNWGSSTEPGHVWFHSDVWSSEAYAPRRTWTPMSFSYFRPQTHSEHEAPTAKCHEQGPCDSGFMDTSDGASTRDNCSPAANCAGGDYVDNACNCVCQAAGACDSKSGSGFGGNDSPSPTSSPVRQPSGGGDEDETCPLVSSGFGDSRYNGEWTYVGEHEGKPYYQYDKYFVVYSDFCVEYMITDDIDGTSGFCRCGRDGWDAKELSQCEWYCWDGIHASAKTLNSCGENENENENKRKRGRSARSVIAREIGKNVPARSVRIIYDDEGAVAWAKVAAQSSIGGKGRRGAKDPAMQPSSNYPSMTPTSDFPTRFPTSRPVAKRTGEENEDEDEACPLVTRGFVSMGSVYNGNWTYLGEHNGKPYYQHDTRTFLFVAYNEDCGEWMIFQDDIDQPCDKAYCLCGSGKEQLSQCAWDCGTPFDFGRLATTVIECGSSDSNQNITITTNGVELIAITTDEALAFAVALLICVNVCVVMELMRRRAGAWCTKTRYAKVQMVEEDSEAEQILQVSN